MKVILQENVANLGKVGEIVKVKDGYGRNYLVPNQLAVIADERNVARMDHQRSSVEAAPERHNRSRQPSLPLPGAAVEL